MRGAGCVLNDLADRDFDGRVERTANRPIPSGQVSPRQATAFMIALCLIGLLVLIQFNQTTIWLGIVLLVIGARFLHEFAVLSKLVCRFGARPALPLTVFFKDC